jgi:hypothetical protein
MVNYVRARSQLERRKRRRQYYLDNRQRALLLAKRYYETHRERARLNSRRRYAKLKALYAAHTATCATEALSGTESATEGDTSSAQ